VGISAYAIMFGGVLLLGGRLGDLPAAGASSSRTVAVLAQLRLRARLVGEPLIAFRACRASAGRCRSAALALLMTTSPRVAIVTSHSALRRGRRKRAAAGAAGGVLTSYLSWPAIFFINVPVGLAAIALTPILLRESRADLPHRHFDFAGAFSVTAGLMLLVYALTQATSDGWTSTTTLSLLAGSLALIVAFVVVGCARRRRSCRSGSSGYGRSPPRTSRWLSSALPPSRSSSCSRSICRTSSLLGCPDRGRLLAFALTVVVASNVAQFVVGVRARSTLTIGCLRPRLRRGARPAARRRATSGISSRVRARRRRHGLLVRPGDDREPLRSRSLGGGRGVGSREHEPPDRGRHRAGCGQAIAAASTSSFADDHGVAASSTLALDHGFRTGLIVLAGLLVLGAVVAAGFIRSQPTPVETRVKLDAELLQEAA
jgi:hypothetical protein